MSGLDQTLGPDPRLQPQATGPRAGCTYGCNRGSGPTLPQTTGFLNINLRITPVTALVQVQHLNSYVPSFQKHMNIMRSTYEMLTSNFVELKMTFLSCVRKVPLTA